MSDIWARGDKAKFLTEANNSVQQQVEARTGALGQTTTNVFFPIAVKEGRRSLYRTHFPNQLQYFIQGFKHPKYNTTTSQFLT